MSEVVHVKTPRSFDKDKEQKILRAHALNLSNKEIHDRTGLAYQTINSVLKRHKLDPFQYADSDASQSNKRVNALQRLFEEDKTLPHIPSIEESKDSANCASKCASCANAWVSKCAWTRNKTKVWELAFRRVTGKNGDGDVLIKVVVCRHYVKESDTVRGSILNYPQEERSLIGSNLCTEAIRRR